MADVFYGVDNTFLSRALEAGIYEPYASPALADIPAEFKLDPQQPRPAGGLRRRVHQLRQGLFRRQAPAPSRRPWKTWPSRNTRACWWSKTRRPPPRAWPSCWRPSRISAPDGYLDYWKSLQSQRSAGGQRLGNGLLHQLQRLIRQGTAAAGGFLQLQPGRRGDLCRPARLTESPTASITGPDTCFRQVEFVGILKGTTAAGPG